MKEILCTQKTMLWRNVFFPFLSVYTREKGNKEKEARSHGADHCHSSLQDAHFMQTQQTNTKMTHLRNCFEKIHSHELWFTLLKELRLFIGLFGPHTTPEPHFWSECSVENAGAGAWHRPADNGAYTEWDKWWTSKMCFYSVLLYMCQYQIQGICSNVEVTFKT